MFTTLDLSLNQYHHVFFQVEPDTSNVLTTYMYDNAMNSLGTIDVSFGAQSIVSALTSFDQNGANPYAIGVDHTGSTKVNMDLAFWGMYTSALKDRQRQTLMKFTNQTLLEPHSQATIYLITVTAGKFYVDDDAQPILVFSPGYYVFDQRHASNANHPLLLSTTANGIHGGGTEYTTGVVKNGTPGSLNAYTLIHVTENTPDLFYYCANHFGMGGPFTQVDTVYYVKVVQNVLGEYVYALSTSANGPYYNQMDLSFNAGEKYLFNVGDSSNDGYRLEFGTTVDDVATINTANVVRDEDEIVLNLSGYTGDALYYFEDTSAGMGYVEATEKSEISTTLLFRQDSTYMWLTDPASTSLNANNESSNNYSIMNNITNYIGSDGKYHLVYEDVGTSNRVEWKQTSNPLIYDSGGNHGVAGLEIIDASILGDNITSFVGMSPTQSSIAIYTYYDCWANGGFWMTVAAKQKIHDGLAIFPSSFTSGPYEISAIQTTIISNIIYSVTVAGSPLVFDLSGTLQSQIDFSANTTYVFHQSDPTNDGYQIVFGTTPDASDNYVTGKTIMGTPGQPGAYTLLELPADFTGSLFYYHDTIPYMGYGPITLSTDLSSAGYGDVVTFTVTNRTGVTETYTITGVVSADISGASLSGSIGYGQQLDLSYVITGSDKTMVFSVGDLSANVSIIKLIEYEFAVQTNAIGDPVYAVYDVSDAVYYNQPVLSFSAPNMYQIDLSSSTTSYDLQLGTLVDNTNTVVDSYYIKTIQSNKWVVDLRTHNGNALHYFDASVNHMGYTVQPTTDSIDRGGITITDTLTNINANPYTASGSVEEYAYANGTYTLSASNYVETSNFLYHVLASGSGTGFDWLTNNGAYDASGVYTGATTTAVGAVDYKGEWIQIQLPYHLVLSRLQTQNDTTDLSGSPKIVHLMGSNDNGSTFEYVVEASLSESATTDTPFTTYHRYSTFRMVVESTHGGSDVRLGFWSLSGTGVSEFPFGYTVHTQNMTVAGDPEVFYVDGVPQGQIDFSMNDVYLFDQSDETNVDNQIFFGSLPDGPTYESSMLIVGTPGRTGAYTKMELDSEYVDQWFYYHKTKMYMGYGPIELSPDNNTKMYGDDVVFSVINRTGVVQTYEITGVVSSDIGGADLSGSLGYGLRHDLSYAITGSGKTMVFSVGDLSATVNILINYEFAVQTNILGDPVFAVYDVSDSVYYNQPDLSFSAPNMYQFDLSSSVVDGGYTLVFGTEVDNSGTVVESGYVTRETGKVILDLREYTGDALYYFEDTSAGMGYVRYNLTTSLDTTSSLIDLETEVLNDNYSMEDKTDVNGITKNSFHVSNKQVIPGPNSTTNLILNSSNGNGYMVYMFWAYVYDDVGNTAAPTHETVNGNLANIFNPGASFLGFSNRALCFLNGDITNFPDYKASTAISAETWTHCAIVLEFSTGTFKAYYNGNEQSVTNNQYSGNTGDFYVQINSYGTTWNSNIPVYINDLHISNSASSFTEAENIIIGSLSNPAVVYDVTVAGGVFDVSGTPQLNVQFTADTKYIFDQSDPTNDGYQIVFGTEPDAASNYTTGKTVMGTPGQEGAYTKLDLPANFSGPLFYYHDTIPYMGYGPLVLSVDNNAVGYGDVVTFTVTNRTGVAETYTITGIDSTDISGASLSGSIGYGQQVDLSYVITGYNKTMVFSVGDLSANVNINPDYNTAIEYEFAVQTNILGDPVFAVYDVSDSVYYNQPDLSFAALYLYQIDLSSSVTNGGYTLVFGTEVDNSGTVVESGFVTRDTQNNSVTLDLRTYTGDPLVYFEDVSAGMGYVKSPSETVVYDVSISGGVFDLSGTPQLIVQFTAETSYVFDQSDPTNSGHTLVFGRNPDTTPLFTDGVTVMGEAGRAGAYTQIDLSAGFTGDLYYFSDASANMGGIPQPIIADATNDWIGSSNQDDPQFSLANFLSFVQSKGITVTENLIDSWGANIFAQYNVHHAAFPNGDKNFRFWAANYTTCWLDFTAPISGTCELKYGNNSDQTRIYLNNFTNYIDRIGPGNSSTFTSKTHTFSVTQGDIIRLEEYQLSVSYFYHIKFTP